MIAVSFGVGYVNNFTPPAGISDAFATGNSGYPGCERANSDDLVQIHTLPANIPKLVRTRNFVNWRRSTYLSSAA
jgi:hypothetical protein